MQAIKKDKSNRFLLIPLGACAVGVGLILWAVLNYLPPADYTYNTDQNAAYLLVTPAPSSKVTRKLPKKAIVAKPTPKVATYSKHLKEGVTIGSIYIPAINHNLRIVQGTTDASLKLGVGHFKGSVLPGVKDNCVLSGHRDSVFAELGTLKKGDRLIVSTTTGKFTYTVRRMRIVEGDDRTVIVPTKHAELTLTTCYPFHYFGHAPQRYIVSADLKESKLRIL
ncbi:MAG: class D sortase [Clostridia bacterium]